MINNLKKVAAQISNDSIRQLLSFTVDPAHDSASKLLHYAKNMEAVYPSWDFLTVDKKALYKLPAKNFLQLRLLVMAVLMILFTVIN